MVLASVKEVFNNLAFRGRIEPIGLNKVVLHRIPRTRQTGLFKTGDVAESFGMYTLTEEGGKAISSKSL